MAYLLSDRAQVAGAGFTATRVLAGPRAREPNPVTGWGPRASMGGTMRILDPVGQSIAPSHELSPRPSSLEGLVVGVPRQQQAGGIRERQSAISRHNAPVRVDKNWAVSFARRRDRG